MARQGIEIERQGLRSPRERVWDAMLKMRGPFTLVELHCRPAVKQKTVESYTAELLGAGHVRRVSGGELIPGLGAKRTPVVYERVSKTPEAPRLYQGKTSTIGAGRLACWRAMRVMARGFSLDDLVRAASVEGVLQVARATVLWYVQALTRTGYLQQIKGTPTRWRLVHDTGPHAPAITRRKCVFDRNTGSFAELETAQEVCDALD